jgi:hypothetical protein
MNAENKSAVVTNELDPEVLRRIRTTGNLAGLTREQQDQYYLSLCEFIGIDPLVQPFNLIEMPARGNESPKVILYANKACFNQLRAKYKINISVGEPIIKDGICMVQANAVTKDGHEDEDIGATGICKEETKWVWDNAKQKNMPQKTGKVVEMQGEDRANAIMKAVTKAKRRVTLSICGLGLLDETEVEDMRREREVQATVVNTRPNQVVNQKALQHSPLLANEEDDGISIEDSDDYKALKKIAKEEGTEALGVAWAALDRGKKHFLESSKDTLKELAAETDAAKAANDAQDFLEGVNQKARG